MNTVTHSTYRHYKKLFQAHFRLSIVIDGMINLHKDKEMTDSEFLQQCSLMQGRYPFKTKGAE
jgi:hypothetical protein